MAKADEILDAAESFARATGYNGFSFRDIAAEVGIKSASVHYHFPTKGDLGAALARRYTDRFMVALGEPTAETPLRRRLERYIDGFRRALAVDGRMCLCGMLGAEIAALPPPVARETGHFFSRNVEWLQSALGGTAKTSRRRALFMLSTLEGALIVARSLADGKAFDDVADELTDALIGLGTE